MARVRAVGVVEEEPVQIFNATPEETVFSNPLLVQIILKNLPISDLKICAPTNPTFHSESTKLLDKKSIINLNSIPRFQSYFESLKNGGRIPTTSIVEMKIGTRRAYAIYASIPSPPKRFPNLPLEIMRRIGGDKVRGLRIHVEMTNNFLSKSRKLLSLAVNLSQLNLDFKNIYGRDTNFVAVLPSEETFQLPHLKKLSLSSDEVDADGEEGIRTLLRRIFSISQNLQKFQANGCNNGVAHLIARLFFEELAKIPGRMEKITDLFFTPDDFGVVPVFRGIQGNFGALRVLTLNVDDMNSAGAEEILEHFKRSLTKLVINLGGVFDDYNEDGRILRMPVMPNLELLELYKGVEVDEDAVDVVIIPSAGIRFEKLWHLEISVALMRSMFLPDPARFPALTHVCLDEREDGPRDEFFEEIWDIFPAVKIARFT